MDLLENLPAAGATGPLALAAALVVLALVDSTSTGTLVLPVWVLLRPGPAPVRRVLLHLGVVAGCYALLGAALLLGGRALWEAASGALAGAGASSAARWAQLVLGAGLLAGSFALDSGRRRRRGLPDRTQRWRERVERLDGSRAVLLAAASVAVEVATMLPYLAALGLIGAAHLPAPATGALLVGYCLVMVAPALVLLALRALAARRVEPVLRRVDGWLGRRGDSALGWAVGVAGFLVARDAVAALGGAGAVRDALAALV
ncbi:GAP family protein [Kineococcus sp. SYSU DK005]|uniref:GAP family protein n=1 Tax=Kineococcus sp. SYSU DK005 TaxID=3383126 RepID=UPI003D7E751C